MRPTSDRRWPLALCVALSVVPIAPATAADRPNVLYILADDLGFSDLGCYGGEIETPNLDRLAEGGLRYTHSYNTARCWPSRAALLTGYYAQQVNRDPWGERPAWGVLLPELLGPAGYRSYHSGKWHVDGPALPTGFERSYLVADQDRFFSPRNHQLDDQPLPQPGPEDGFYATVAIADHAIRWLDEHREGHGDEPFFLYLAFTAPHFPLHALPEDVERYRDRYRAGWDALRAERWERLQSLGIVDGTLSDRDPITIPPWNVAEEELKARIGPGEAGYAIAWDDLSDEQKTLQAEKMAIHAAMVDRMDREIGRVLERLEAMGALEDTLILFASDNGASAEQLIRGDEHDPDAPGGSAASYLCLGPGWSTAANTPFRLHKSWVHEGGICTPMIAHWPAGIPGRGELRGVPNHLVDVVPTLLELAGLPNPEEARGRRRPPLPGISLVPSFAEDVAIDRESLFFDHSGNHALRVGDWKIVSAGEGSPWELYDLSRDRTETNDLADRHPEKVEELARIWADRLEQFQADGAGRAAGEGR